MSDTQIAWTLLASGLTLLVFVTIKWIVPALKRANAKIETAIKEELGSEEEILITLPPTEEDVTRARKLLKDIYGLVNEVALIRTIIQAELPGNIRIGDFESLDDFMSEIERIAGTVTDEELRRQVDERNFDDLCSFLWSLRNSGQAQRWVAPLLVGDMFPVQFLKELNRRTQVPSR